MGNWTLIGVDDPEWEPLAVSYTARDAMAVSAFTEAIFREIQRRKVGGKAAASPRTPRTPFARDLDL